MSAEDNVSPTSATPAHDRNALVMSLGFLTEEQMIEITQVKKETLEHWRKHGKGPIPTLFGRAFFYALDDVKDYMHSLRRTRSRESILRSI